MRAFSSGCSALTGIEAVSNSMPSFKKPRQKNAQKVLYCLAGIIFFIFGGSIILAHTLHVLPVEGGLTVVAQMGQAVFGTGSILFYVLQFATMLILLLAANTAYTDLPNLLSILARDGFMPRQFTERGAKLTLSNGIIFILFAASLLIVIFGAQVHHLIPLYSVGVFLSFTISQSGMVKKWIRDKEKNWKTSMLINVLGTIMTAAGLVIVFIMKFSGGAWILAIIIPALSISMHYIHSYYASVKASITISRDTFIEHYHPSTSTNTFLVVVLIQALNRPALKCINYANQMSANVALLHVAIDKERATKLKETWATYPIDLPLITLNSPFRDVSTPIEEYLDDKEASLTTGHNIAVVMTRYILDHPYDTLLHNQTTHFISRALRQYKEVSTVLVPYHVHLNH
jgi:hypothetical protein